MSLMDPWGMRGKYRVCNALRLAWGLSRLFPSGAETATPPLSRGPRSPNNSLVSALCSFLSNGHPYRPRLVMEHMCGGELFDRLCDDGLRGGQRRARRRGRRVGASERAHMCAVGRRERETRDERDCVCVCETTSQPCPTDPPPRTPSSRSLHGEERGRGHRPASQRN